MKTTDKFLIGIVAGIILLVVIAFVLTVTQPEPVYQAEDTPGGVSYNYLLALQKKDYERVYSYLYPRMAGYPRSVAIFTNQIRTQRYSFYFPYNNLEKLTFSVKSEETLIYISTVTILASQFSGGSLFESGTNTFTFKMQLHDYNGKWMIEGSDRYFLDCWNDPAGCSLK